MGRVVVSIADLIVVSAAVAVALVAASSGVPQDQGRAQQGRGHQGRGPQAGGRRSDHGRRNFPAQKGAPPPKSLGQKVTGFFKKLFGGG
jgi:hypothetical protein